MTQRPKGKAVFLLIYSLKYLSSVHQLLIITTVNTCVVVTEGLRALVRVHPTLGDL